MFGWFLDNFDEARAAASDEMKQHQDLCFSETLVRTSEHKDSRLVNFHGSDTQIYIDQNLFCSTTSNNDDFVLNGGRLSFRSDITTCVANNNIVTVDITLGCRPQEAIILLHHWNADRRSVALASFIAKSGASVFDLALPYHFERSRSGSRYADHMLSADLGRTILSFRQAVLDARKLVRWLNLNGYEKISIIGMSLGSWVAGLISAHEPLISEASLLLSSDSLAEMVWTGRATRALKDCLSTHITLPQLESAWRPLNLSSYAEKIARPELRVQIILASRDKVVLPDQSLRFAKILNQSGAKPRVHQLCCGHYSLGKLPFSLMTGLALRKFHS